MSAFAPLYPRYTLNYNPKYADMDILVDPLIQELAKTYGRSSAQIVLNRHIEKGHVMFPKAKKVEHLKENMEIFSFKLIQEDYKRISGLNKDARYYHVAPVDYEFVPYAK